jgi:hypothetical protein
VMAGFTQVDGIYNPVNDEKIYDFVAAGGS